MRKKSAGETDTHRKRKSKPVAPPLGPDEFLKALVPAIVAELAPPVELMKFTTNPTVVGAYVEAKVRRFVKKYLNPIRVSSGTVIDHRQSPGAEDIPQLDTVVWIPDPLPAVFEVGDDFGVVPRSSCLGILEIKTSAYAAAIVSSKQRTDPNFVNSVVAPISAEEGNLRGSWDVFGMAIICIRRESQERLLTLRENWRVAILFEEKNGVIEEQCDDIFRFIQFLSVLRFRGMARSLGLRGIRASQDDQSLPLGKR